MHKPAQSRLEVKEEDVEAQDMVNTTWLKAGTHRATLVGPYAALYICCYGCCG